MKGDVTLCKAEALIRLVLYTSPDRKNATLLGGDCWVDRETALGPKFRLHTEHEIASLYNGSTSGRYRVVMFPLIRRIADPRGSNEPVVHVTVYLAKADDVELFADVEQLAVSDIRESMLLLDE